MSKLRNRFFSVQHFCFLKQLSVFKWHSEILAFTLKAVKAL